MNSLQSKGLKMVRIGLPVRMDKESRSFCLQSLIEAHSSNDRILRIEERIKRINEEVTSLHSKRLKTANQKVSIRRAIRKNLENLKNEKEKLKKEKSETLNNAKREILCNADVVCATCIGCGGSEFFDDLQFCLILMDEASQTIEPSALIPLIFGCSEYGKFVMIGDQKQLRPLVTSQIAKQHGLDRTLFDRLVDCEHMERTHLFCNNLLQIQYRMHPDIAQWPNSQFYDGLIENAQSTHTLKAFDIDGFVWPHKKIKKKSSFFEESPLIFIDVCGKEQKGKNGDFSICNVDEAKIVVSIVSNIIDSNKNLDKDILSSIGVISGYNAQCALIYKELENLYGTNSDILDFIEIESVDGFQGREKELIILSCVRSNSRNQIGFMRDERRMNVALSRARRGLIVIGNAKCLRQSGDKYWRDFIDFMTKTGRIVDERFIGKHLQKRFVDIEEERNVFIESFDDNYSNDYERIIDIKAG